jgi:hypothetical protein
VEAITQLQTALDLFERIGIEVRLEHLGGAGGSLCSLRSHRVLFVDLDADLATRLDACVTSLGELPEVASLYVPPELRERIERAQQAP